MTEGLRLRAGAAAVLGVLSIGVWLPAWGQGLPDNRGLHPNPTEDVTPAYRGTLDERDDQRLDDARREGGSFLPTLQGQGVGKDVDRPKEVEASPGPPRLRPRVEPAAAERPEPRVQPKQGRGAGGGAEFVDALLRGWQEGPAIVRVRYAEKETPEEIGNGAPVRRPGGPNAGSANSPRLAARPLPEISAGDGFYARTLYAVDSDFAGPVLLEVLEPPLAGAVASGSFTRVRDRMVVRLTSLQYRGVSAAIDAWAVGLDCACYGIEGEVDRHFIERVLMPAAFRFAQGYLAAAARPRTEIRLDDGSTIVERDRSTGQDLLESGLVDAVGRVGDVITEDAPSGPTVRIPRNTEVVLLFIRSPETAAAAGAREIGAAARESTGGVRLEEAPDG